MRGNKQEEIEKLKKYQEIFDRQKKGEQMESLFPEFGVKRSAYFIWRRRKLAKELPAAPTKLKPQKLKRRKMTPLLSEPISLSHDTDKIIVIQGKEAIAAYLSRQGL